MPGIDDVLERLVNDAGFRGRLAADPAGALAGYDLSSGDLALLASQVTDGAGASGAVEARTSRASLIGFMSAFGEVAEALSPTTGDLDLGSTEAPADAIPTESISFNFEQIKVTYDPEATTAGDLAVTESPAAPAPQEEFPLTYQKVELEQIKTGSEPPATADLAAPGDDANTQGDVDGRDFLIWQRSAAPPADGSDALVWDVGDGSDGGVKAEEIELQSWAPSAPPAQADVGPIDDEIKFAYKTIDFSYDAAEPDALATPEGGDGEPTGPIADVLYSSTAGGSPDGAPPGDSGVAGPGPHASQDGGATWAEGDADQIPGAGTAGFVPVVGDWNGDSATADGDTDGRDFLAWQRNLGHDSPDPGSPALSGGDGGSEAFHVPPSRLLVSSFSNSSGGAEPVEVPPDGTAPDGLAEPGDGSGDLEPLAVKLENAQITSYQLGVLDTNAPDLRADNTLPDEPGSTSETE